MPARLVDAGDLVGPAVEQAISGLELASRDNAAAQLARRYAACIDGSIGNTAKAGAPGSEEWALRWIGPLLLDALESLGATPAARTRIKEVRTPGGVSKLALLRDASRGA